MHYPLENEYELISKRCPLCQSQVLAEVVKTSPGFTLLTKYRERNPLPIYIAWHCLSGGPHLPFGSHGVAAGKACHLKSSSMFTPSLTMPTRSSMLPVLSLVRSGSIASICRATW